MKKERLSHVCVLALTGLLGFSSLGQATEATTEAAPVVATVEGQPITEAELEARIKSEMMRINNQIYTTKKQAVDALITDRLLGMEAAKRGISRQELIKQEVTGKVAAVTDAEIEKFYNDNKARMGNKPLEEMKERVSKHLQSTKNRTRQQAFHQELRKAAAVKVHLKPPIFEVATEGSPTKGPADARVTLVEFSDYQ